jgi:hypothetical protein
MSNDLSILRNDPFAAEGAKAQHGKFLKFAKGDYIAGIDADLMNGTALVALMPDLMTGCQKWASGKLLDERLGLIANGFQPPARDTLGDTDEALWEPDVNGEPKDPWVYMYKLPLVSPDGSEEYVFGTSSNGGKRAIADLCKAYARRTKSSSLPVVQLESSSYVHPNKALGRVKVPALKVVGWADAPGSAAPAIAPPPPAGGMTFLRPPTSQFAPASQFATTARPGPDDDIPF